MPDSPYPELKKTHTMAHTGRPYQDYKPPAAAPVWAAIEGLGRYHTLVAALQLGVFEALAQPPESHTADALAQTLAVSPPHLEALLDSICAMELLDRVNPDLAQADPGPTGSRTDHRAATAGDPNANDGPSDNTNETQAGANDATSDDNRPRPPAALYKLNDTARRYLLQDGAASMTDLIPVAPGPARNWEHLAQTVRQGRPPTPIDGPNTNPADFYLPLVEGTFTTVWRAATRSDLQLRYSALAAPRVLDLGAGGAPWSIAVLQACPQATAVINDLPGVLNFARAKTAEHGVADRCEFRPGNFHEIQIEPDRYDLVVLGHVCRTEGPEGAQHLLRRAYKALAPEGRVVMCDYFVGPEPKHSANAVLMGMTMMAATVNGFAITNSAASQWLRHAGFEAIRLIEPIGFQFAYVAGKPKHPATG